MSHDREISHIELTRQGLAAIYYVHNKKIAVRLTNPISCLRTKFEVEKGATLRPFFEYIKNNKELSDFISKYSWVYDIDAHHAQLENGPSDKNVWIRFTRTEVYWAIDRIEGNVNWSTGFEGFGIMLEDEYPHLKGEESSVSFSSSPIVDFCDLPFVLNKRLTGIDYDAAPVYDFKNYFGCPDCKDGVDFGERQFTFLDVLDAIYGDISFYGSPSDAESFINELKERKDEIENDIKNNVAKLVPVEDVFDRIKKRIKNEKSYMMNEISKMNDIPVMKIYDSLEEYLNL